MRLYITGGTGLVGGNIIRSEHTRGLGDGAFGMQPFRLNRIEPGALDWIGWSCNVRARAYGRLRRRTPQEGNARR